jgi:hypothetical protein
VKPRFLLVDLSFLRVVLHVRLFNSDQAGEVRLHVRGPPNLDFLCSGLLLSTR